MELQRPKEGRWIARPKRPRWLTPVMLVIILTSQMPSWMNTLFLGGRHSPIVIWLAIAFVAIFVLILVAMGVRSRLLSRLRPQDRELAEGAFGDQYLVEVTIAAGQQRLGTDRGVLWFADGLMGFSGDATSFVLAAEDIQVPSMGMRPAGRNRSIPQQAIVLKNAPREGYFVVHPIGPKARGYRKRLHEFARRLAHHEAERIWPPLVPYEVGKAMEMNAGK